MMIEDDALIFGHLLLLLDWLTGGSSFSMRRKALYWSLYDVWEVWGGVIEMRFEGD